MKKLPTHIAFIMDGNRRWAVRRGLSKMLGHNKGAEVLVNGKSAGVRIAPPYRFDITDFLKKDGENELRIEVYNTLANFYLAIPTRYGGSPVSGLLTEPVIKIYKKE